MIGVYVSGGWRGEEGCCSFFEVSIDLDTVIFIKMRFVVFCIHHLEFCVNYELFYNGHSYPPIVALLPTLAYAHWIKLFSTLEGPGSIYFKQKHFFQINCKYMYINYCLILKYCFLKHL